MTPDRSARPTVQWTIKGGGVLGPAPFLIAGIVNVTPDSFFDGGRHAEPDQAVRHARLLLEQGADMLDVGGESTRPGAAEVTAEEELRRVLPVVEAFAAEAPVCVDTFRAATAARTLEAGASVINDVSACRFDPELLDVVAQHQPGYVLMHSLGRPDRMQDGPRYGDVVADILAFFEERLGALTAAGLDESRIVLDPGIGFGKLLEHNLAILRGIDRFLSLGLPVYLGLSNKSLWEKLLGLSVGERGTATQAATALCAARGAGIHRVHDVKSTRETLTVVRELM